MNTTVRQGLTSVSYLLDCWRFVESVRQGPIKYTYSRKFIILEHNSLDHSMY